MRHLRRNLPNYVFSSLLAFVFIIGFWAAAKAQQVEYWMPQTETHMGRPDQKAEAYTVIGPPGEVPPAPGPAPVVMMPSGHIVQLPNILAQNPSIADTPKPRIAPGDKTKAMVMAPQNKLQSLADNLPTPVTQLALPDLEALSNDNAQVRKVVINVRVKGNNRATDEALMTWDLSPVEIPVFIGKLAALEFALTGYVDVPESRTEYQYIEASIFDDQSQQYAPIRLYANRIAVPGEKVAREDEGRSLEYWLFGTAKTFKQRVRGSQLLDILTFDECLLLGHTIVETDPRQCVLPNGTTYLEVDTAPLSKEDIAIRDFDACLKQSHPLIMTFPRKCVAPGGRVFIEPPKVNLDPPRLAPKEDAAPQTEQ